MSRLEDRGAPGAIAALRARLADGPPLLGAFTKLQGLEPIACVAQSGLDFAVIDMEHSQLSGAEARAQLAYAEALGFPCLVRLRGVDAGEVGRYLEAGAVGIQLADVRTEREAAELVRACRFPPLGERGVATAHRRAGFGRVAVGEYVSGTDAEPLVAIQIECAETGDPLEAMLATGVDLCFVGVVDLSVDLGVPGEVGSAAVADRLREIGELAAAAGVAFGHHATDRLAPLPAARYTTVGSDLAALTSGLAALERGGREALRRSSARAGSPAGR